MNTLLLVSFSIIILTLFVIIRKNQSHKIEKIFLEPSLSKQRKTSIITRCNKSGSSAIILPDFYDILLNNARVSIKNNLLVFEFKDYNLNRFQEAIKRSVDIIISCAGLIITLPLLLICAMTILFTSPGPVFYSQPRMGKDGRTFLLYKFRTMVKDAENKTGPVLALEKDPRITPTGRILRATRLDELPQFINVLKGEMSIVGPRPERPFFVIEYLEELWDYEYRHSFKPGITGLAQVAGEYSTSPQEKLRFDLYYICNYSILLDIKIICLTIPAVLNIKKSSGIKN